MSGRAGAATTERERFRQFVLWTFFVEPHTSRLGVALIALALVAAVLRLLLTHYEDAFLDTLFAYLAFSVRVAARGNGSEASRP